MRAGTAIVRLQLALLGPSRRPTPRSRTPAWRRAAAALLDDAEPEIVPLGDGA
jgi:hypothetical protein